MAQSCGRRWRPLTCIGDTVLHWFLVDTARIGADSAGATGNFARYSRKNREPYLSWLCCDFLRCEFNSVIIVQ